MAAVLLVDKNNKERLMRSISLNTLFPAFCTSGLVVLATVALFALAQPAHSNAFGFIGDEEVEVTLLSRGRFIYPSSAQRREIEGNVVIEFSIDVTGAVIDAFVVEANPPNRFERNALRYVRSWKYEPVRQGGVPAVVEKVRANVAYRLAE